jgi:hypothetical protein
MCPLLKARLVASDCLAVHVEFSVHLFAHSEITIVACILHTHTHTHTHTHGRRI